jgi:SAM-dependent methyltransferase
VYKLSSMKKLSEKSYWDSIYNNNIKIDVSTQSIFSVFKKSIKHLTRDYSNYVLWEVLCKKYLPYNKEYKVCEVGCAPGKYLIYFHTSYGYVPYGVEYSEKGVEITKENFRQAQLDPEGVIQADFFDADFQLSHKEKYDVVFSRGFIEHFDDVGRVVDLHSNLLKKGGYMVIMIPNLSGINKVIAKLLNKASFDLHNTSIMNKEVFTALFSESIYHKLYCGYVGFFSIGLFNTDKRWKYYFYRLLLIMQRPVDLLMRSILGNTLVTSSYSSPYLLCIAQKK